MFETLKDAEIGSSFAPAGDPSRCGSDPNCIADMPKIEEVSLKDSNSEVRQASGSESFASCLGFRGASSCTWMCLLHP